MGKVQYGRGDTLSPDADVYERLRRLDDDDPDQNSPERWHAVLRRVIRAITVTYDEIVIEGWRGEPTVTQRGARRTPRGERETAHDPRTGRFVARSKVTVA